MKGEITQSNKSDTQGEGNEMRKSEGGITQSNKSDTQGEGKEVLEKVKGESHKVTNLTHREKGMR